MAHAPRCATRAKRPFGASQGCSLGTPRSADEPLESRLPKAEIDELKVVTEGLARKTGALSSKVDLIDQETKILPGMIDRLDANQNFLASAVAKKFTMLDQYFRYETKAETETEQDPLAISAKDDTFPVCCSPLPRARVSRRGVGHPVPSLLPASHPRVESGKCGLRRRMESCS